MLSTSFSSLLMGRGSFCVVNLGCKVNKVESDSIAAALIACGCVAVPESEADLIVVNTCTVTGEADKKARKAVRHALSASPDAEVLVTGCAVAIDEETYRALGTRVRVVQRAELLARLADLAKRDLVRFGPGFRTRVPIKVQDGCNRACTYCIVHVARGPAASVAYESVLEEADRYLTQGVKEVVLTGIDLGSYCSGGARLSDLVGDLIELADRRAVAGERPARIRASSLEPHTVSADFIDMLSSADGRLCRHLHLPLQSGSSKVLREMARPYSAQAYADLVTELYAKIPELSLTTDIICGFPGETDDEFSETLDLARTCRFSKIHVFPYSMRAGTPAAARDDQIDPQVKAQRCARLRSLSDALRHDDLKRREGMVELAVVEGATALTESYHEIAAPAGSSSGSLVEVVMPAADG